MTQQPICWKCGGKRFLNADGTYCDAFQGSDQDPVIPCDVCCPPPEPAPAVPQVFADTHLDNREKPRLGKQNLAILRALVKEPQWNADLSDIALKYTSRITDLRKNGFTITAGKRDREDGLVLYTLAESDRERALDFLERASC